MHHFDIAHLFHYIPPEFRYIHVARVAHHGTRAEHSSMSREKWVETLLVDLITTTTTTTTNEKKYTRTIVENAHDIAALWWCTFTPTQRQINPGCQKEIFEYRSSIGSNTICKFSCEIVVRSPIFGFALPFGICFMCTELSDPVHFFCCCVWTYTEREDRILQIYGCTYNHSIFFLLLCYAATPCAWTCERCKQSI